MPKLISERPKLISTGFYFGALDWILDKKAWDMRSICMHVAETFAHCSLMLITSAFKYYGNFFGD